MSVRRWDSLSDFLESAEGIHRKASHDHWDLGVSAREAKERARTGDLQILDKATALIDRIDPDIGDVVLPRWEHCVAGSRVVVGDYITGKSTCMRRRAKVETSGRCIDVYVALESSCGIDALDLITRGCAIIALLETLQRCGVSVNLTVGVECSSFSEPDKEIVGCFPIESRPLDLASASFILAHPAFPRNVMYEVLERDNGFTGHWSKFRNDDKARANYIGLKETDVYVPASWLYDSLIIDDPKKWVEERVRQCLKTGE